MADKVEKSVIWSYFDHIDPAPGGKKQAKCKKCPTVMLLSQRSTSSMWKHLEKMHRAVFKAAKDDQAQRAAQKRGHSSDDSDGTTKTAAGDGTNETEVVTVPESQDIDDPQAGGSQSQSLIKGPSSRAGVAGPSQAKKGKVAPVVTNQPSIKSSLNRQVPYDNLSSKQVKFDRAVSYWLAIDNHAFASVEGRGFKALINHLDPRMTVKTRTTYSREKLESLYQEVKALVDAELNRSIGGLVGIGFTTDMWTSRNNDAYMALTAHFINDEFELKSFLVGMKPFEGAHTGVQISIELDSCIEKVVCQ